MKGEYTKHQQGIIKRYYDNADQIQSQRLAELVTDIYLAEGKKLEKLWLAAGDSMKKLKVPQTQIDNLVAKRDPALLAALVKEIMGK